MLESSHVPASRKLMTVLLLGTLEKLDRILMIH